MTEAPPPVMRQAERRNNHYVAEHWDELEEMDDDEATVPKT